MNVYVYVRQHFDKFRVTNVIVNCIFKKVQFFKKNKLHIAYGDFKNHVIYIFVAKKIHKYN